MSKYVALFSVSGYVEVEVDSDNLEKATMLAYNKFDEENDFSKLESMEADLVEIDTLENLGMGRS